MCKMSPAGVAFQGGIQSHETCRLKVSSSGWVQGMCWLSGCPEHVSPLFSPNPQQQELCGFSERCQVAP